MSVGVTCASYILICPQWKPTVSLRSGESWRPHAPGALMTASMLREVLLTVQDKLNNPSPEDPFDPDIAAVRKLLFFSGACFNDNIIQLTLKKLGLSWL